jgi:cytochrome c oxidase subunit 1
MHFLGLAGMPRRIPDYPDAYAYWNSIASVGSYVSLIGLLVFFVVIYHLFDSEAYIFNNKFLDGKFYVGF